MCGRFYIHNDTMAEIVKIVRKIDSKKAKTGDIYPSEPAMVLRADHREIVAEVMNWGYNSNLPGTKLMINARSETVQEKPMFRKDYEIHRCVVPANKFYEWKKLNGKSKEKYDFFVPEQILYLAGVYQKTPEGDRFTILTKAAEGCMQEIHHRMPVIIQADQTEKWLYSKEDAVKLLLEHCDALQRIKSTEDEYEQMSLF